MKVIDGATMWRVKMKDGSVLGIWAGGVEEFDGNHVFTIFVEATDVEQNEAEAIPTNRGWNHEELMIAVASIPVKDVADITTADWEKIPQPLVP